MKSIQKTNKFKIINFQTPVAQGICLGSPAPVLILEITGFGRLDLEHLNVVIVCNLLFEYCYLILYRKYFFFFFFEQSVDIFSMNVCSILYFFLGFIL